MGRITSPKDVHILISGNCKFITLSSKGDDYMGPCKGEAEVSEKEMPLGKKREGMKKMGGGGGGREGE